MSAISTAFVGSPVHKGRSLLSVTVVLVMVAASVLIGGSEAVAAERTAAACGGTVTFGRIVSCPTIGAEEQHVYTITTTRASDILFARLTQGPASSTSGRLTAPNGDFVCFFDSYASGCQLGAAGTYTLTVSLLYGDPVDYKLAVESARTPSACAALPHSFFSFASPGVTATLPTGAAVQCYRFQQPVGTVLRLFDPGGAADVLGEIRDAQLQPVCYMRDATTCTLTSAGPYRLFLGEFYGTEATYTLKMPRLSQAFGCPALKLAPFGDPGSAVGTGTLVGSEDAICHKLRVATAGGILVRTYDVQNWSVYDNAGQRVCDAYQSPYFCGLAAAGDYVALVESERFSSGTFTYQIAATPLYRNAGCASATSTAWNQPSLTVSQNSAVQINCQLFRGKAGDRIVSYVSPDVYNDAYSRLVDATGAAVCSGWSEEDGCVLPADGTYRVLSNLRTFEGEALTYRLQIRRLSQPVGCPVVTPGAYGAAPAGALGGIRCRILSIPAAGQYRLKAVDVQNYDTYARVYDSAGLKVCGSTWCDFTAPGRYTLVVQGSLANSVIDNDFQYALALLPNTPSGCVSASDTGYQDPPRRVEFTTAGQYHCTELPSPAGSSVVQLNPGGRSVAIPDVIVVDSTGQHICDESSLRDYSCQLAGTAPFFIVHSGRRGTPTGTHSSAYVRVDNSPACPVLPRDATGATATTGANSFVACFSIPADQHAAQESFTHRRTSGTGGATLHVFSEEGYHMCGRSLPVGERTLTCSVPDGRATVLLEADAVDATYQVTHRDGT